MATPDFASMSDADLKAARDAAEMEHKRRGQFTDLERILRDALQGAVELGVSKAKVQSFFNRMINEYYPPGGNGA